MLNVKESIESIRKPGSRDVFIDESASQDGNRVFLGALIVDANFTDYIKQHINSLREEIKKDLFEFEYPLLATMPPRKLESREKNDRKRIMEGGLPEIHAVAVWNGTGVYSSNDLDDSIWFDRHFTWIEKALSVLSPTGTYFAPFQIRDVAASTEYIRRHETSWYDRLKGFGSMPEYIKRERVDEVIYEPYTRLLMEMLLALDGLSERYDWKLNIECDKGKPNSKVRTLKAFDIVKRYGLLGRFSIPEFKSSDSEPLLQLADLVTYIHFKKYTTDRLHPQYNKISHLYSMYIEPRIFVSRVENIGRAMTDARQYAIQTAVTIELLMVHSPGVHSRHDKERRRVAEMHIKGVMDELQRGVLKAIVPKEVLYKKNFK